MIYVNYHRRYHVLTVSGHAYSGTAGQDLVCAAASMLAQTLAANVQNLEAEGSVLEMNVQLGEGAAEIRCTPCSRYRAVVSLVYDTICMGFRLLARDYPANLTMNILE